MVLSLGCGTATGWDGPLSALACGDAGGGVPSAGWPASAEAPRRAKVESRTAKTALRIGSPPVGGAGRDYRVRHLEGGVEPGSCRGDGEPLASGSSQRRRNTDGLTRVSFSH